MKKTKDKTEVNTTWKRYVLFTPINAYLP